MTIVAETDEFIVGVDTMPRPAAAAMELLDIQNRCPLAGGPPFVVLRLCVRQRGWVKTEKLAGLQPASFLRTT
ncbi:hypothetical protein [Arthrobacter globiformis]|uniref:hypothetical protein n=1 Tax=Arthrobacter globiformis TaxID=1665 RepID=UPI00278B22C2|nr:hypothetical protein [Arthrobacter globiformis]MDQ0864960.1 hypothetical protein [Arthrobacter globiformis]